MKIDLDLSLTFPDLPSAFNDIRTGYTPTNSFDKTLRDFSKLENIDTPTPLENVDPEIRFVYPPNTARRVGLTGPGYLQHSNGSYLRTLDSVPVTFPSIGTITEVPCLKPIGACYEANSHDKVCQSNPSTQSVKTWRNTQTQYCLSQKFLSNDDVIDQYTFTEPQLSIQPSILFDDHSTWSNSTTDCICRQSSLTKLDLVADGQNKFLGAQEAHSIDYVPKSNDDFKVAAAPKPNSLTVLEKAFVCDFQGCTKRFARIDELKRHQRTHSNIRHFVCEFCSKGFTRSDHLMTHRRTHTGERPYPCTMCDRQFARSDERNRHMKVHLKERSTVDRRHHGPRAKRERDMLKHSTRTVHFPPPMV